VLFSVRARIALFYTPPPPPAAYTHARTPMHLNVTAAEFPASVMLCRLSHGAQTTEAGAEAEAQVCLELTMYVGCEARVRADLLSPLSPALLRVHNTLSPPLFQMDAWGDAPSSAAAASGVGEGAASTHAFQQAIPAFLR
jgi:hypothetical protein